MAGIRNYRLFECGTPWESFVLLLKQFPLYVMLWLNVSLDLRAFQTVLTSLKSRTGQRSSWVLEGTFPLVSGFFGGKGSKHSVDSLFG